ncbi:BLUF domain-containing protein [Aureimonas ureilytica]|uniref:BLUF domain-containing protein n=1 Tax=Aureimonas ureilytica TaxID=401562 RepID=UPI000734BF2D|nr:BLUF domain-containing protein [Aureimonas ureilytica]
MALLHLSYISTLAEGQSLADLVHDLGRFRERNLSLGITGCIAFENRRIMQVLEGPVENVERLFEIIARDPRHCDVIQIERKPIERVSFGHWGMVRRPIADVIFLSQLT